MPQSQKKTITRDQLLKMFRGAFWVDTEFDQEIRPSYREETPITKEFDAAVESINNYFNSEE